MLNDTSIQELSPATYSQHLRHPRPHTPALAALERSDPADESLQIDMESFDRNGDALDPFHLLNNEDDFMLGSHSKPAPRGNTTARSFTSDQFATSSGAQRRQAQAPSSSKYFPTAPAGKNGSKSNPFSSTKADTEKRRKLPSGPEIIVPASSDNEEEPRAVSRSLAISAGQSPPRRPEQLRAPRPLASQPHNTARPTKRPVASAGQPNIVAALGLADKNGRPMKGLAMGAKASRRA